MITQLIFICTLLCFGCCFADSGSSPGKNPKVLLKTNKGDILIELFADKAPISSENFLKYVRTDFYDGTIFHRVIDKFMVQGGGFDKNMIQKTPREQIKNEADNGLSNERGTLAMARTAVVDSASSQFFINVVDNPFLDHRGPSRADYGYAVFGKVVDGMDIVDQIRLVETESKGAHQNVPKEPVVILDAVEFKN